VESALADKRPVHLGVGVGSSWVDIGSKRAVSAFHIAPGKRFGKMKRLGPKARQKDNRKFEGRRLRRRVKIRSVVKQL
jgi:hypothetical protein